ncbi:MAG: hypothetical protein J7M19_02725 [Planctomycetes bacterium]|nr:hypothetical protein [Planctomycetota bacterium]
MSKPGNLEHDTLEEAPESSAPNASSLPQEPDEAPLRPEEARQESGRGEKPWCAADNPEIWTVIAGELDED